MKEKSKTQNSSLKGHTSCVCQVTGVSHTYLVIKELNPARTAAPSEQAVKGGRMSSYLYSN